MHSSINSGPLEYLPATFSVFPALGDVGDLSAGVSRCGDLRPDRLSNIPVLVSEEVVFMVVDAPSAPA